MKKFFTIVLSIVQVFTIMTVYTVRIGAIMVGTQSEHESIELDYDNYEDVKNYLRELGADDEYIEGMSDARLIRCRAAMQYQGNISDDQQNQLALQPGTVSPLLVPISPIIPYPGYENNVQLETYEDDWINMHLMVTNLGNGDFNVSLEARWKRFPGNRYFDSLGIVLEEHTLVYGSASAWTKVYDGTRVLETTYEWDDNSENIIPVSQSGWQGMVLLYNLVPRLDYAFWSGYTAYIEFNTEIDNPSLSNSFNVWGTHDHAKLSFDYDSSLSITIAPPSIGFNIDVQPTVDYDRRRITFDTPIQYEP